MGYFSFTLTVQILLLTLWDSDIRLNKLIINKDSPKVWNKYITKFIYRYLNKCYSHTAKTNDLFLQMLKYSESFRTLKRLKLSCYNSKFTAKTYVIIVSGKFCLLYYGILNHEMLNFKLHPLLRLNFTFHSLFTPKGSKLEVSNLKTETVSFSYTGQHSIFYLYPAFKNIQVNATVKVVTSNPLEVHGSFTILKINLIYNVQLFNGTNKQPKFSYCINSKYILLLYFIKVRKINQVFIKIRQFMTHKYIIYDGPGILTTFIRIKQSVTKCSTFQCTIQLLVQNVFNSDYFRFYSMPLTFSDSKRTIQGTKDFVDFPNKKCLNYVCILSVDAEYQQQLNITIYKNKFCWSS